jgi:hypothetical protein
VEAGTCPLQAQGDAAPALLQQVLIQQVQQQNRDQPAKVVVDEASQMAFSMKQAPPRESFGHNALDSLISRRSATGAPLKTTVTHPSSIMPDDKRFGSMEGTLSMLQMSTKHVGMGRLLTKAPAQRAQHLRGWTAPLDEDGYKAIVSLKSDDDMDMFMRRVIDAYDCKILNQGGFMGVVPWFSGTTAAQTFVKLQETLMFAVLDTKHAPWLSYKNTDGTTGSGAELSFMGYVEVAALRKEEEMVKFARRVCDKVGVKVVKEDGFMAMVRWYSGADNFQDYGKLEEEIKSAARGAPHSWAAWRDPTGH